MLSKKINKMIIFWILIILLGTCLTIYGSLRLNDAWTESSILKQAHVIPDFILLDCDIEIEIAEKQRIEILKIVSEKIHGQDNIEIIALSPFFDQANSNYLLPAEIINDFLKFEIFGQAFSKDGSVDIGLSKSTNTVEILGEEDKNKSYIQVLTYNSKTNKFKVLLRNIVLDVSSTSKSQLILDLKDAELNFKTVSYFQIKSIKNIYLKTKKVKYFFILEMKQDKEDSFKGILKSLV